MRVQISSAVNGNSVVSRFFGTSQDLKFTSHYRKKIIRKLVILSGIYEKFSESNSYILSDKDVVPSYKEIEIPFTFKYL
jgi:hypothetical protein